MNAALHFPASEGTVFQHSDGLGTVLSQLESKGMQDQAEKDGARSDEPQRDEDTGPRGPHE